MNNPSSTTEYVIKPPKGLISINLPELWRFRELLYIFVWRDLKVRYKQTALGIIWAIFQPLIMMIIFTLFFGVFAKIPSDGAPYPIFVYSGLLLWNYFSHALTNASESLVSNQGIIQKIYFPRLFFPLSTIITPIIDFVFALLVFFGLMAYYHYSPGILGIVLIPVFLIIAILTATGLGLLTASLNVKYRDVRHILPFFIQTLFFLTPVIYPINIIPAKYHWIIDLNPMAGTITSARNALLHTAPVNWLLLGLSFVGAFLLLLFGLYYFRKTERYFADII